MKRRLSVTNLRSENNLPMFRLNAPVINFRPDDVSQNVGKLF